MTIQPAALDEQVTPTACSNNPLNEINTFSTVYLKTSALLFCYKTRCFAIHQHTWRETAEAAASYFSKSEADEHHSKC